MIGNKMKKHKNCKSSRGGGQGMCTDKCTICKQEFIYQSGLHICERCLIDNKLCYVCGKVIK